jgi:hypothetical protein
MGGALLLARLAVHQQVGLQCRAELMCTYSMHQAKGATADDTCYYSHRVGDIFYLRRCFGCKRRDGGYRYAVRQQDRQSTER